MLESLSFALISHGHLVIKYQKSYSYLTNAEIVLLNCLEKTLLSAINLKFLIYKYNNGIIQS